MTTELRILDLLCELSMSMQSFVTIIMFLLNEVFIKNIFWSEKCNKSYVS